MEYPLPPKILRASWASSDSVMSRDIFSGFWVSLYAEVRAYRDSLPKDAEIKRRGFAILFNPPRTGGIMLIGLNPSRTTDDYARSHLESEIGPPDRHLYETDRAGKLGPKLCKLARKAVSPGSDASPLEAEILKGTKTNVFFFGSGSEKEWNSNGFWGSGGKKLRDDTESRCIHWCLQIIAAVNPQGIIFESITAFKTLAMAATIVPSNQANPNPSKYIQHGTIRFHANQCPFVSLPHPTGARIKNKDSLIVEALATFWNCYLSERDRRT